MFIRHFPAFYKTQYGKIPKRYRIDGGREYSPEELEEFLQALGTVIETTTARNPHQDGTSERAIRIIIEKMRTTVIDQNIPLYLWPKLLSAIIHVSNRTATSLLDGVTLY